MLFVALGLGAVVAASTTVYIVIKVVGALYVVWLGIQSIRHRSETREALDAVAIVRRGHPLRIGFIVGLMNPKTILFFVAFLPQFTAPGAGRVALQMIALGVVFGALAICSDSIWVLVAGKARQWFARDPKRLDKLGVTGGAMMVGMGAVLLVKE